MPANYAHYQFGNLVLKKINNDKIVSIIENNRGYYNIGLQGPDILFFYHPLKSNFVNELGNQMHQNIARDFFEKALEIIDSDEAKLAYIFGFINHYILDSECHSYIEKVVEHKEVSHYAIERDLDFNLINRYHDQLNYRVARNMLINHQSAKTIAPFFNLVPDTILTALKSFRRFTGLFACKNKIKRQILIKGMQLVKANTYSDMVMQDKVDDRIIDDINFLLNLFDQATNIAAKEIIGYYDSLINKTKISDRFNYNYE
ncbi:zinc dependent phospholipase C family protein [uncultured Thomasclavelia sp.]|uniref:zinc dependent phospholipase C family protein n=1 Tax=uncultured Thomasclavelia sp. TaxID=3025759 RepID=UPI0025D54AB8|nr:zinc dependent phospholipase C family protein [uncultured Thomasclavelia sp.]